MCDPLPLLYVRYTTWGQLSLCRDFGADERHVFAPIGLQDAMIIKNPYILYTYIYIYIIWFHFLNRMIATLKQKAGFQLEISSTPKNFPERKECHRAAWWPLWAEYGPYRGTLGVGEQLRTTGSSYSCRAGGRKGCVQPLAVQNAYKIMKILRRCGINQQFPMGKNPAKTANVCEIESTFWSVRHCDIVTGH